MTTCRTLCGQLHLFTSAQTNPTPDITLTKPRPFGGQARGRQGQLRGSACFGGVFPKKNGRPKTQSRPIKPASCRKLFAGNSCK